MYKTFPSAVTFAVSVVFRWYFGGVPVLSPCLFWPCVPLTLAVSSVSMLRS